jgi:hypothetical protein
MAMEIILECSDCGREVVPESIELLDTFEKQKSILSIKVPSFCSKCHDELTVTDNLLCSTKAKEELRGLIIAFGKDAVLRAAERLGR